LQPWRHARSGAFQASVEMTPDVESERWGSQILGTLLGPFDIISSKDLTLAAPFITLVLLWISIHSTFDDSAVLFGLPMITNRTNPYNSWTSSIETYPASSSRAILVTEDAGSTGGATRHWSFLNLFSHANASLYIVLCALWLPRCYDVLVLFQI